jgi:fatty-acyl-CoA synthase
MKNLRHILPKIKTNRYFSSLEFKNTKMSICNGPTGVRLLEHTIGETLHLTALKNPYVTCLISAHQNIRRTYEEMNYKVDQVAKSLISLGLPIGSKIGVYAPNSEEWVLVQFACARVGFILVNINPAYQVNDLKYVLNKVGINCLIMPRMLKSTNYLEIITQIAPELLKSVGRSPLNLNLRDLPQLKNIILLSDSSCGDILNKEGKIINEKNDEFYQKLCGQNNLIYWHDFLERKFLLDSQKDSLRLDEEFSNRKKSVKVDDPTNIQFTSGTTGLPKGAVLSHYNIMNNGYLVGRTLNYSPQDKVLIQVPLYHCFGAVMGNLACIAHGATIVYPNGTFDSHKSVKVMSQEKATSLYGVPTMFIDVLNTQQKMKLNISSVKKGIMAGSVCPKYLMDRCILELGMTDLTICYGMTELSPVSHQTSPYDNVEKKTSTVGSLLPHTITKIVDEDGEIVERNVVGEICTKSYGLMLGYYEDSEATNDTIRQGFMKTGDLGYIDDDGYLHIEGRKKDTIIRGGENISPKELEDFLGSHPMIEDVQVIAVKDEKFGDEICTWIKVRSEYKGQIKKDDIINFCKKKIAHYKIPRYVRFVDSFPMTVTGKPQKFKMREISNQILKDQTEFL